MMQHWILGHGRLDLANYQGSRFNGRKSSWAKFDSTRATAAADVSTSGYWHSGSCSWSRAPKQRLGSGTPRLFDLIIRIIPIYSQRNPVATTERHNWSAAQAIAPIEMTPRPGGPSTNFLLVGLSESESIDTLKIRFYSSGIPQGRMFGEIIFIWETQALRSPQRDVGSLRLENSQLPLNPVY